MKNLKTFLLLLVLLLWVSWPSWSDVVLTDAEYNQIMTALNESEAALLNNSELILKQDKALEYLQVLPNLSDKIITEQLAVLEPLAKSLKAQETALKALETENGILRGIAIVTLAVGVAKLVYELIKDIVSRIIATQEL